MGGDEGLLWKYSSSLQRNFGTRLVVLLKNLKKGIMENGLVTFVIGLLQAALLARGRVIRQAKLLFYAKLAEKSLATYERDGWGEFPTQIVPERREIRPTADRGPILLCVDTSGSMRGAREIVAKALALECMRAAKAQERGCYVFAFSGPSEVWPPHFSLIKPFLFDICHF